MAGFSSIAEGAIGELPVEGGVLIQPTALEISVSVTSPLTNTVIFAPVPNPVVDTTAVPFITAGKSISPQTGAISVQTLAPLISIGFTLFPPAASVGIASSPADIQSGNVIVASNTVTMTTPYGEIGSTPIGEYAIGEGDPASRVAKITNQILVSSMPPLVSAGKSVFAPFGSISVSPMRPEIDSRQRKLRVFAIAS